MININCLAAAMARRCTISSSRAASIFTTTTSGNTDNSNININSTSSNMEITSASIPSLAAIKSKLQATTSTVPTFFQPLKRNMSTKTFTLPSSPDSSPSQSPTSTAITSPIFPAFHPLSSVLKRASGYGYNPTFLPTSSSTIAISQKRNFASKKHKRVIKMAKGFRGRAKNTFRAAIRRVEKGLQYAYRDRKVKKRNYRKLWIERVNAGVRQHGMSYSRFVNGMQNLDNDSADDGSSEDDSAKVGILLNRKVLADLAANEPFSFKAVVDVVKMNTGEQK
mmetsp:Transcript_28846/g.42740  ORF Transcript_28846/g.42740 Transcript_28846/m.42740 type:complete len:280 (+) Transcript_28846:124-963(+)